eukprot:CAMPEP_0183309334 /NCGR_PEP_ID=MMETSP0160_2-20130417/25030_1 /TAXON_ID=2839 ORGANISM="Odontella Sinensis, Strain Grunow 1884" /NCGR_SAMPLE_ID=MMETSP0160_2 /ASSEMBLY_ACC=CAM_ASM_000250 /LENGTH=73 /DNA_ID=CAMNT_0025473345 /DNA_START=11 /DNA_END=228 /DNA_ORIENTATION=+
MALGRTTSQSNVDGSSHNCREENAGSESNNRILRVIVTHILGNNDRQELAQQSVAFSVQNPFRPRKKELHFLS